MFHRQGYPPCLGDVRGLPLPGLPRRNDLEAILKGESRRDLSVRGTYRISDSSLVVLIPFPSLAGSRHTTFPRSAVEWPMPGCLGEEFSLFSSRPGSNGSMPMFGSPVVIAPGSSGRSQGLFWLRFQLFFRSGCPSITLAFGECDGIVGSPGKCSESGLVQVPHSAELTKPAKVHAPDPRIQEERSG